MSLDAPQQNKMMTEPPAKKEFHFAGGGIWRNATIYADTIEEAQKLWHATKQFINPGGAEPAQQPVVQSTAPAETVPEESAVQ